MLSPMDPGSFGMPVAGAAVSEKGAMSAHITVTTRGGHSSFPPPHTSVGILARIITELESHPFPDKLGEASRPSIRMLQCVRDGPSMPRALRDALIELEWAERVTDPAFRAKHLNQLPWLHRTFEQRLSPLMQQLRIDAARKRVLENMRFTLRTLFKTTIAADVFHGGIKVNALPERAEAFVNHRIAPYSSVNETMEHYRKLLAPLANELGFSFTMFRGEVVVPHTNASVAHVELSESGLTYDTRASSPFEGDDADAWRLLSQVIRQTWHLDEPRHQLHSLEEDQRPAVGKYSDPIRVSPATMFANTDTRWYHVRTCYGCVRLTTERDTQYFPLRPCVSASRPDRLACHASCPCVQTWPTTDRQTR